MMTRETVIIPVDGSTDDDLVVPAAIVEALKRNADIVLLFIRERPEACTGDLGHRGPTAAFALRAPNNEGHPHDAMSYLDELRRRYHIFANSELVVRTGEPVQQIEEEASERNNPLVVLASQRLTSGDPGAHEDRITRLLRRSVCTTLLIAIPHRDVAVGHVAGPVEPAVHRM